MGGWVGGWVGGWLGWWVAGLLGGWVAGWLGELVGGLVGWLMDRCILLPRSFSCSIDRIDWGGSGRDEKFVKLVGGAIGIFEKYSFFLIVRGNRFFVRFS